MNREGVHGCRSSNVRPTLPMDWLVVSRAYWAGRGLFYDVVLSDSRTRPPTEVAVVVFSRSCRGREADTSGFVCYPIHSDRDDYMDVCCNNQPAMRDLARAYMRAHTAPVRWRPRAHADLHVDNTVSSRLRKRTRP